MILESILLAFFMLAAGAYCIEAGGLMEVAGWILSATAGIEVAGLFRENALD